MLKPLLATQPVIILRLPGSWKGHSRQGTGKDKIAKLRALLGESASGAFAPAVFAKESANLPNKQLGTSIAGKWACATGTFTSGKIPSRPGP